MTGLEVRTSVIDGFAVLALEGELDLASVGLLETEIARARDGGQARDGIALDLRELEFMDSSGLRALVMTDTRLREEGLRLRLIRGTEPVQRVFEITRMTERLDFVDDPSEL